MYAFAVHKLQLSLNDYNCISISYGNLTGVLSIFRTTERNAKYTDKSYHVRNKQISII